MFRFIDYRFPFGRFICFSQLIQYLNNFSIKSNKHEFQQLDPDFFFTSFDVVVSFEEDEVLMKNKRFQDRITINNIAP